MLLASALAHLAIERSFRWHSLICPPFAHCVIGIITRALFLGLFLEFFLALCVSVIIMVALQFPLPSAFGVNGVILVAIP